MWSVERLVGIYAYLAVILRAAILVFQSLVLGGVTFLCLALKKSSDSSCLELSTVRAKCIRLLRFSALLLAGTQVLCLLVNCRVLIGTEGLSVADIAGANFVIEAFIATCAGLLVTLLPVILPRRIWIAFLPSFFILSSTVMTNHAAARMEDRVLLILFTALHLAAAGAWIGGLPYLRLAVSAASEATAYTLAKRFSFIAIVSVVVLGASGIAVASKYVDSADALYGTSYGVMLGAKVCLFAALLILGAVNNKTIKTLCTATIATRLKHCVEAETVIGITVLLAAASLTSQPPAVDLKHDRVNLSTIYERMRPSWPRLRTPKLGELSPATRHLSDAETNTTNPTQSGLTSAEVIYTNTPSDIAWSEYNHNWVGVMLLSMGTLALLSRTGKIRLARHWPLVFLALALFIFVRADPENWPLGPNGFWESFDQIEVIQHRAAALMVIVFGMFEWRVQRNMTRSSIAPLAFPAVCILGGSLLLTHTHALANSKDQLLAELSHTLLAIFAVFAGCARWLELRLPPRDRSIPARIWPTCFMLIGVLLLTYKEG